MLQRFRKVLALRDVRSPIEQEAALTAGRLLDAMTGEHIGQDSDDTALQLAAFILGPDFEQSSPVSISQIPDSLKRLKRSRLKEQSQEKVKGYLNRSQNVGKEIGKFIGLLS